MVSFTSMLTALPAPVVTGSAYSISKKGFTVVVRLYTVALPAETFIGYIAGLDHVGDNMMFELLPCGPVAPVKPVAP